MYSKENKTFILNHGTFNMLKPIPFSPKHVVINCRGSELAQQCDLKLIHWLARHGQQGRLQSLS